VVAAAGVAAAPVVAAALPRPVPVVPRGARVPVRLVRPRVPPVPEVPDAPEVPDDRGDLVFAFAGVAPDSAAGVDLAAVPDPARLRVPPDLPRPPAAGLAAGAGLAGARPQVSQ
jgi:hypothetical protein